MSLPVFRRFSIQDIPDAPDWIEQIIIPLNLFCETTVSALNKNLTISENVQGMKYSTAFQTPADYATGGFIPINFSLTGNGQPDCCLLGRISRQDNVPIIKAVSVSNWNLNINVTPFRVNVAYIAGLEPNTKYNVTLLVM